MSVNRSSNISNTSTPPLDSSLTNNPTSWYIIVVVVIVTSLFGIPANIAVIIKLSQRLRGSSISQRLFFNLAVSDLLCLLCLTVGMAIVYSRLNLTYVVCQLLFYIFFFCISAELNILVLIGIQRYYQILHPKKWARLGRTWQRLLLISTWMLALLQAITVVFSLTDQKEKSPNDVLVHYCGNYRTKPAFEVGYFAVIVFSHLTLLSCYVLLVQGISRAKIANKKQPRATKLFIRIIAVSLVAAVFPLILRLMYVATLYTQSAPLLLVRDSLVFVEWFYFFNHSLNPFLYFFASQYASSKSNKKSILNDD